MDLGLRLGQILVFAPDLHAARQFYADVLGLELKRGDDRLLRFQGSNFVLHIFKCEDSADSSGYSERAGSAVAFAVPALAKAMADLKGRGVRFLHERPKEGPNGIRYVAFTDPFGTVFELVEESGDRSIANGA